MNITPAEIRAIAIHIGDGKLMDAVRQRVLPRNNWAGGVLARRVLQLALSKAGILGDHEGGVLGELNDCVIILPVTDEDAAIAVLHHELKREIPFFYQLAVFRDGDWVCIFPAGMPCTNWLFDTERMEAAHGDMMRSMKARLREMENPKAAPPEEPDTDNPS